MSSRIDIRPLLAFSGRAARPEFWGVVCIIAIAKIGILLAAAGIHGVLDMPPEHWRWTAWPAMAASDLVLLWPLLALFVRRAHDNGISSRSVVVSLGLATIVGLVPPWTRNELPGWVNWGVMGLVYGQIWLLFAALGFLPSIPGDGELIPTTPRRPEDQDQRIDGPH